MKNVHYRKPRANFRRVLRPKDLEQLGISGVKETLIWETSNRFTVVLNNKVSESLVEKLPTEFKMTDAEGDDEIPEVPELLTSLAESASSDPEGSVNESEGLQDAGIEESPPTKTRRR